MTYNEFEDTGLLDKLMSLKLEKVKHEGRLAVVAPSWIMNPKTDLESFLEDFADPLTGTDALRDFACMPSSSVRPFFKDPSVLTKHADPTRVSPVDSLLRIDPNFSPQPGVNYFLAFDLSISHDNLGGAMVHKEWTGAGEIYVLDFSVQVKASHAEPVDYEAVRNLVRTLKRRGFNIAAVGFDQFQSHDSAVILEKEGFKVEIVQYNDSFAGCGFLWDLIHHSDLLYGLCDKALIGEASELQIVNTKRIDHLSSGGIYNSKDTWDAVVNATVLASRGKQTYQQEYLTT